MQIPLKRKMRKSIPWESAKAAEKRENLKNTISQKNHIICVETLKSLIRQKLKYLIK